LRVIAAIQDFLRRYDLFRSVADGMVIILAQLRDKQGRWPGYFLTQGQVLGWKRTLPISEAMGDNTLEAVVAGAQAQTNTVEQ